MSTKELNIVGLRAWEVITQFGTIGTIQTTTITVITDSSEVNMIFWIMLQSTTVTITILIYKQLPPQVTTIVQVSRK